VNEKATVRTLYKKLLALYPQGFRERFGVSMEQSFNDVCNEQKRQTKSGWLGFVLWMFIETAIGIVREHLLQLMEGNVMKNILANPGSVAITSLILSLPLGLTFVAFMFNRTYAIREKIPKIRGACVARSPYFRASPIQLRKSCLT